MRSSQLDDVVRDAATIRRDIEAQLRTRHVLGDRRQPAHWMPRDVDAPAEAERVGTMESERG